MTVPTYEDRLIPFCESRGLAEVRRLRHVENHFHSLDWQRVDEWIRVKQSEQKDETVLISRKALRNSTIALVISAAALVVAGIANSDNISAIFQKWFK